MLNRYYREELAFLKEEGAAFSKLYPALASFLSGPSTDPDVERLLEGFAFLTGHIRAKLDDEFPEIVHTLLGILWPPVLRPIPSSSILKFEPVPGRIAQKETIPRGIGVQSVPTEDTPCIFQTSYAVDVYPMELEQVLLDQTATGQPLLRLRIKAFSGLQVHRFGISKLRLYLSGDAAWDLYYWLCRLAKDCRLSFTDTEGKLHKADISKPRPIGFLPEDSLVPQDGGSFDGYRLLREYFTFPEKFLFIEFTGLDSLRSLVAGPVFEIQCAFSRKLPASCRPSLQDIHLFATPIVNVFSDDSRPVQVTHERSEYRLHPTQPNAEIYAVGSARGWIAGTSETLRYEPFLSLLQVPDVRYFKTTFRSGIGGEGSATYVSFVRSQQAESPFPPPPETVEFSLLCTNGSLPWRLRGGDIGGSTDTSPPFAVFRNISRVSANVPRPKASDVPWILLSHLVRSPQTLASAAELKAVLELYNYPQYVDPNAARANQRRIDSIRDIRAAAVNFIMTSGMDSDGRWSGRYGYPLRGTALHLDIEGSHFSGEGDLFLFASVLNHFFSLYASMNSVTRLTMRNTSAGADYSWPPRLGEQLVF